MNENCKAYPFLISRSYDNDYRVIVVPEFMREERGLLSRAVDVEELTDPKNFLQFFQNSITNLKGEHFVIFFRRRVATAQDQGHQSGYELKDRQGRNILFISGVVIRSPSEDDKPLVLTSDLDSRQVDIQLRDAYDRFWKGNISPVSLSPLFVKISIDQPFPLDPIAIQETPPVPRKNLEFLLFRLKSSKRLFPRSTKGWLLCFILVTFLAVLYWRFRQSDFIRARTGWSEAIASISLSNLIFTDVQSDPYADEILQAVQLNLIKGFNDGTFRPAASITRKQFVYLLVELLQKLDPSLSIPTAVTDEPFSDVRLDEGAQAAAMIQFVRDLDIVSGCDQGINRFCPNDPLKLAEMMAILTKVASYKNVQLVAAPEAPFSKFKGHWSEEDFLKMYSCRVVTSAEQEPHFSPNAEVKRDYAAAAIVRFYNCLRQEP
jgi:hypothetical protein